MLQDIESLGIEKSKYSPQFLFFLRVVLVEVGLNPWKARALHYQSEYNMTQELQERVDEQAREMIQYIKDIRAKDQIISDNAVKIEIISKRMETGKVDVKNTH